MSKLPLKCALAALAAVLAVTSTADARRRHFHGFYFSRQFYFSHQDDGEARERRGEGEARERRGEGEERGAARPPTTGFGAIVAEIARGCREQAGELHNWPFDRITETTAPDDAQRRALEALRDATKAAAERLAGDCPVGVASPAAAPTTLAARLDASDRAIEAVTAALDAVQPALRDFYAALDDEQKARLYRNFGMGEAASPARMRGRLRVAAEGSPGGAGVPWSALCERLTTALRDWPGKRVEREMRLSDGQRGALYELYAAALKAADSLGSDCPAETALTPVRRMQTLRARLLAVRAATTAIRPTLARFNDALDGAQQQRFAATN
jgi:hypothetical protein